MAFHGRGHRAHCGGNVFNGEIYNYKTNSWTDKLYVGGLVGEELRTFHLRTMSPDLIKAELYGLDIFNSPLENNKLLYRTESVVTNFADINQYIFKLDLKVLFIISYLINQFI